jgi:beta-lactam-binding protein with PASTA domain
MDGSSVVLVSLLTSALTAGGTAYVVERYKILSSAGAEAVVPDLRGLSETDARVNAGGAHVALFLASRDPTADARPGTVVRQSVPAGVRVPFESSVSVVLAEDRVPSVLNVPLAEATRRLEERGYTVQVGAAVPDAKIAEGVVLGQLPKADVAYTKPGIVVVQASAGPGDIELPKLLGTGITAAKARLEELGLKPVVRWVAMAETPTNVVLNQSPAGGQKVKPGSEVQLTVCTP